MMRRAAQEIESRDSKPSLGSSRLSAVRVVLCRPSHPGNIGATARAMKTMGFTRLILVQGPPLPDPQAEAMASNAGDILEAAVRVATLADALRGCYGALALTARSRELATPPLWAREAAAEMAQLCRHGDVALVFGNETTGLSNEELAICGRWAMIPANPAYSSLNLAAAVQVMCYEMRLALSELPAAPQSCAADIPARHDEIEGLLAEIESAAITCGFLDPQRPGRLMLRLRRLFARARLEKNEVNILRGLIATLARTSRGDFDHST
ncbi:MAG: RNA methyltransferase [Rhodocyclaceae bacterium]|nr:RNA methyltransferase [Rhodocyclaceae bacterium]